MCVCHSSAVAGSEEDVGSSSRQRHNRHGRDGAAVGGLEKRLEELEKVRLISNPHRSKINTYLALKMVY